jgi:hypothetical protein
MTKPTEPRGMSKLLADLLVIFFLAGPLGIWLAICAAIAVRLFCAIAGAFCV